MNMALIDRVIESDVVKKSSYTLRRATLIQTKLHNTFIKKIHIQGGWQLVVQAESG